MFSRRLVFFILAVSLFQSACRTIGGFDLSEQTSSTSPIQFANQIIYALQDLERHPEVVIKVSDDGFDAGITQESVDILRNSSEVLFDSFNANERKQYFQHLKQNLPKAYKPVVFTGPGGLGETFYNYSEEYSAHDLMTIWIKYLFTGDTEFDLKEWFERDRAIRAYRLVATGDRSGVQYDGVLGRHIFSDQELNEAVYYLATSILVAPEEIKAIMNDQPREFLQSFMINQNDETGASRSEPSDLIKNALKHQLLWMSEKDHENNIQFVGAFSERIFQKFLLGEAQTNDVPFVVLRDSILDDEPILLCAGKGIAEFVIKGEFSEEVRSVKGNSLVQELNLDEVWNLNHRKTDPKVKFFLRCNGKLFEISMESLDIPKIDRPILTFTKDIHAVSSIALVGEMSKAMFLGGISYLTLNGYLPEKIDFIDNLKQEFMAIAADGKLDRIILPVGHAFDQRRSELGTSSAIKILARRKVGNRNIYLHIFLPPLRAAGNSEVLTLNDMQAVLCGSNCEGIVKNRGSVAIMTTSCHSSSTLDSWMLAFYQAIRETDNLATPTVFASNEGYNTDNPFVIVSHLDHIFRFINGVAEGNSPEKLKAKLSQPLEMTPLRRALEKFAAFSSSIQKGDRAPSFQNSYSPVCNIDREEYFNAKYKVYDLNFIEIK